MRELELLDSQKGKHDFYLDCVNNSMNDTNLVQRGEAEEGNRFFPEKLTLQINVKNRPSCGNFPLISSVSPNLAKWPRRMFPGNLRP